MHGLFDAGVKPGRLTSGLSVFQRSGLPVRLKKTRQNKELEPRSDSIGTEKALAVVELVEVAHRLHDRLEVRSRIERVEQLRGVGQQPVRARNRDSDIVPGRVGK